MRIDRQRVTAVQLLEQLGYTFNGTAWTPPTGNTSGTHAEADALHSILMDRAEKLAGSPEASQEEDELATLAEALEAYEAVRWPGKR